MAQELKRLIRSGAGLITVETSEEAQFLAELKDSLGELLRPMYRWSITDGLKRIDMDIPFDRPLPPDSSAVLEFIRNRRERSVFVLLDFHPYLRYASSIRQLRDIVLRQDSAAHTILLLSPRIELPDELKAHAQRYQLRRPDEAELALMLRDEAAHYQREHMGKRVEIDREAWRPLIRTMLGLSLSDARTVARAVIFNDGVISSSDIAQAAREKFKLLNAGGVLSLELDAPKFEDIAGLKRLKRWIEQRKAVFRGEQTVVKLDPPRGVLLLGVQGCGKSLAAKAVAAGFGVPLLKLDFGALYNKFHGETERNLRESLAQAEAMAPCVLWCDEVEKGMSASSSDDGVSKRVLGTFLTWMAERKAPVFMIATANQIEHLPPELLRKGRFDEIFFVDLPDAQARHGVFLIHLKKRDLDPARFALDQLVEVSQGFSGAEIEQAVVSSLYAANAEATEPATRHILDEIKATRPLSVVMAEKVSALRAWAAERCVPAD